MSTQSKKLNDFNDYIKVAVVTAVNPQNKTVDVAYLSQGGNAVNLNVPSSSAGLTYGSLHMPVIGDRVLIQQSQGGRPLITGFQPVNINYLSYVDPGEHATTAENGSFIQFKNKRKRAISTNELLDYNATTGPNGSTNDVQYEPGSITIRARSKKSRDGDVPRFDSHSYLSLFDNGDVTLQACFQDVPKGLIWMDGASGYVFLKAGNGNLQEYIEMDPTKKQIYIHSDGETQLHSQTNHKHNIYNSLIYNIGQGFQMTLGQSLSSIPANMDDVTANNVSQGDVFISNTGTAGSGNGTLHLKGNCNITLDQGNFNIITTQGTVNISSKGNITVNSQGSATVNSTGPMNLTSDEMVNIGGNGGVTISGDGDIKIGSSSSSDSFVRKSEYDAHFHIWNYNGPNDTSPPTVEASNFGVYG
jgi:hypothetical protein